MISLNFFEAILFLFSYFQNKLIFVLLMYRFALYKDALKTLNLFSLKCNLFFSSFCKDILSVFINLFF